MGSWTLMPDPLQEIVDDVLDVGDYIYHEHSWLREVQVHPTLA